MINRGQADKASEIADREVHGMEAFNWASMRENLSSGGCDNKGTDQPAHPHRLISTFVIRSLESITSKLAAGEISIF